MFKVYETFSRDYAQEIFPVKKQEEYNLRNQTDLIISYVKSVNYGIFSVYISNILAYFLVS